MPKKLLSLILSLFLITPLFAVIIALVAGSQSLFAKADEARENALDFAFSESFSENEKSETPLQGDRYIVKFKNSVPLRDIEALLGDIKYSLLAESESRLFAVVPENEDFFKANAEIIDYYEKDVTRTVSSVNDPLQVTDFESLGVYDAWNNAAPHNSIVVAVLDTGVYRSHEDLWGAKILAGYDAVAKTANVKNDTAGHGTGVIGIIAATANNNLGVAGVASGVSILPIKVSASGTTIYSSDLIRGIRFAADGGAKIINMSIGGYSYSIAEQDAINYAAEKGCVLVAAAGNGGNRGYADKKSYPASYENVVSVASCDAEGNRSSFSQYNDMVDVAVIGEDITMPGISAIDAYVTDSGTSFSCAIVSGIAALAAASVGNNARFEYAEFMALITDSLGNSRSDALGHGIINAKQISELAEYPIISGVANNMTYGNNVTIHFNRGTATLDGESISDGEAVFDNGSHRLTVNDNGKTKNVVFRLNYDPLNYEFREFSDHCYFQFQRGTALLDGFPYKSQEKITTSGTHTFILADGDEKIEKTFSLDFSLPAVYGITDGGNYSHPVEILIVGDYTATLNDKTVKDKFTVYKSGEYQLKIKSGNGGANAQYNFKIEYENTQFGDIDYSNGKIVTDEENGFFCLYGDSLVGIRIYDINNPQKYLHFIPIGKTYGHAFTDENLLFFSENGVTVISRENALLGADSVLKTFAPEGIERFVYEKGVLYGFGGGNVFAIDIETETAILMYELGMSAEIMEISNGNLLFASPSHSKSVYILNVETLNLTSFQISKSFQGLVTCFQNEYFCAGNQIYDLSGNLVLEFQGFWVNAISEGKVYTEQHIINLENGEKIGSFPFDVSDIAVTQNKVYVLGSDAKLAVINKTNGDISDFDAAPYTDAFLGKSEEINEFRNDCFYYDSQITDSATFENDIFLILSQENSIYRFNAETLTESEAIPLKYAPSKIFVSGGYLAVSFKRTKEIYISRISDIHNGKYLSFSEKCDGMTVINGIIYLILGEQISVLDFESEVIAPTSVVAEYMDSDGEYLYISNSTGIYKYSKDLSIVAQNNNVSGKITVGYGILIDKTVYDSENLSKLITLPSAPIAYNGFTAVTSKGVYSVSEEKYIGKSIIEKPDYAIITDSNKIVIFGKGQLTVTSCRHADEITATTEINGIEEGGFYIGEVKIKYTHGIGYLDGIPFESGGTAKGTGEHILSIALPFGNNVSVSFTIGAQLSGIKFLSDDRTMSVGEKLNLQVQYLPNGASSIPIKYTCDSNGITISESGEVTALATGRYTVKATAVAEHGTFTTSCVITVRSDIIAFNLNSDYNIDRDNSLILGVPMGTTATKLFSELASGKNAKLYDKNGKEHSGFIGTGNTLVLKDSNGNETDRLTFALVGDIDGDGFISAYDLYTMETVLQKDYHPPEIMVAADINLDSRISNGDFRALRHIVLGVTQANTGANMDNPFGDASLQTVSYIQNGDIIEAVVCLSGCKYVTGLYGKINFGSGLEFIECESSDWEIDIYEYSDSINFYAYDSEGKICGNAFKGLITLRFRVVAQAGENISITSKGFKATFNDGCKNIPFKNYSAIVSQPQKGDFEIFVNNAVSFRFNPEIYDYSIVIPFDNAVADIGVVCGEDESYTISSCIIPNSGTKTVTVGITHNTGITEYYNIQIKRDATPNIDSNCKLMILEVEGFKLSPAFKSDFYDYYLSVPFGTENINVYCVAENKTAAVNISDTTIPPEGTLVNITVSAPDGESLVYRIHVSVLPKESEESSEAESIPEPPVSSDTSQEDNGNGGTNIGDIIGWIFIVMGIAICIATCVRNIWFNNNPPAPPPQPDAVEEALKDQAENQ